MTRRGIAFGTALAAIAWVAMAIAAPRTAAAGWLVALVFVSAIPLGSLAWMMIHTLTGGHWGDGLRPDLALTARTIPLLALFAIPVLIAVSSLYPWAHGSGTTPSVARFYLNVPLFLIRSLIAVAGWSVLAFMLPRADAQRTPLLAAMGLAFHALMISLLSVDWILSVEATFISTSFGATVAITQLLAALAFAALVAGPLDDRTTRDLAGLMLTSVLGVTYLNFMAVLVMWYGDLPDRVYWFVERITQPWLAIAIAAFVFASLLPIAALLLGRVRRSRAALRAVGVSILFGIALFDVWLLAPPFGPWPIAAAIPALFTMAGAFVLAAGVHWPALASRRLRRPP